VFAASPLHPSEFTSPASNPRSKAQWQESVPINSAPLLPQ
jgi:hypothetical protein